MWHPCSEPDDEETGDQAVDNDENEAPAKRQKVLLPNILLPCHTEGGRILAPGATNLALASVDGNK